jgi:hypothetical protein
LILNPLIHNIAANAISRNQASGPLGPAMGQPAESLDNGGWMLFEWETVMELSAGDILMAVMSLGGIALTCCYLVYGYVKEPRT